VEDLFAFQTMRIEQPGTMFANRASYRILTGKRELLAVASEVEGHARVKLLRESVRDVRSFAVTTTAGVQVLSLVRRLSDWHTDVEDPRGELLGRIRTEGTRRHYTLLDDSDQTLGQATGDLGLKRFAVTSADGGTFARVQKRWAGLRKEMLTSSDHYRVEFIGPVPPLARTLTVMLPIVLDLTSYEPM
jgi:Scramblase